MTSECFAYSLLNAYGEFPADDTIHPWERTVKSPGRIDMPHHTARPMVDVGPYVERTRKLMELTSAYAVQKLHGVPSSTVKAIARGEVRRLKHGTAVKMDRVFRVYGV